jgi:uncharacterized repeat protein (TIGR03803 family)
MAEGGQYNDGTVFRIRSDGTGMTVLWSFNRYVYGASPGLGLCAGWDGFYYGTTVGDSFFGEEKRPGTIFALRVAEPPVLAISRNGSNRVRLEVNGLPGVYYLIEHSDDLTSWMEFDGVTTGLDG